VLYLCWTFAALAQPAAKTTATVPRLVQFSGALTAAGGQPLSGVVGVTFSLYEEERGGAPLWMETQNVQADGNGRYTAMLGATRNDGIPAEVLASEQGRWLGVQPQGETEQPRVLLVSVPYALKAGDADTLAGRPASAYLLAAGSSTSAQPAGPSGVAQPAQPLADVSVKTGARAKPALTSAGTTNYISKFTDASGDTGNSIMYQNGSNIGVGTTAGAISMDIRPTATSPFAQLGVAQTVDYMTLFASDTYGPAFYWDPTKALRLGTGGTGLYNANGFIEYMRIQPNGYVGIGTQTPGATLEVDGNGPKTIFGQTASTTGIALAGTATATTGSTTGVAGTVSSPNGAGVSGYNSATSGTGVGVSAGADSPVGSGLFAYNNATTGQAVGVSAESASPAGIGVLGQDDQPGGVGVGGYSGATTGGGLGLNGYSASTAGIGVNGYAGAATGTGIGVQAGVTSPQGIALLANANGGGLAGQFNGNVLVNGALQVTGTVSKGGGSFKIDHPLDPANKYLSHSFVESPDMMNIYNGNVTTNERGLATIVLPDYFEALNGDFRYQLTVIGQFAQAMVAKEIRNGRFTIETNRPKVKVSWQVTGVRHDAYANAHRIPVTEDKPAAEQGTYLHPDVFHRSEGRELSAGSH